MTGDQADNVDHRSRGLLFLARVILWLFSGLSALWLLAIVVFSIEAACRPKYDENHPDYRRYSELFNHLADQASRPSLPHEHTIDFSGLSGGQWTTACLFGGYTDPLREIESRGALIDEADRTRLIEARSRGFRVGTVEEFEALVAYVDPANRAHFVHFRNGIGASGQHFERCIQKPDTTVSFQEW